MDAQSITEYQNGDINYSKAALKIFKIVGKYYALTCLPVKVIQKYDLIIPVHPVSHSTFTGLPFNLPISI